MTDTIISSYQENSRFAQQQVTENEKQINIYSFLRLGVFALLVAAIYFSVSQDSYLLLTAMILGLAGVFALLIRKQNEYEGLAEYYRALKIVNDNEVENIKSRGNVYDNGETFNSELHYYSGDLDIFGKGSLYQLVNRAATTAGRDTLANWFNGPATKEEVVLRQLAVKELIAKKELKLDLQARLHFATKQNKEQMQALYTYLRMPLNLTHERQLDLYSKIVRYLAIAGVVLSVFYVEARYFLGLLLVTNSRLTSAKGSFISKTDLVAGKIGGALQHYAGAFNAVEKEKWESERCGALAEKIRTDAGTGTSGTIKQLAGLINKLNVRLNMLANMVLNALLLWNIKQIIAIENWKRNNHQNIEEAFIALGELEALLSLAGQQINNPQWCFPEIADGDGYTIIAKGMAHPLISPKHRVDNDYSLDNEFKVDIITGSNMAGKSTFLRTIGINAVLGLSGAPVCALSMKLSVIQIISYMRIKDSLNDRTSTFKAELDRLKMLLDAVEQQESVFFLIDEMLRGTNSVDKYLGSKAVIERLISKGGVGQVATHDLQIADLENDHPAYVRNFYFDIEVKNGQMLFDYKIKPGACKTFNASLLLKQIGIDVGSI